MNLFLEESSKALTNLSSYDKIHIVLGNESCDLDSAISSLVYAYFIHKQYSSQQCNNKIITIPVLNINRDDFPLRTETKHLLKKNEIAVENLTFRDSIDFELLHKEEKLNLTLVDHHVLLKDDQYLSKYIVEIIDHRPIDKSANLKQFKTTIDPVGSCCTLIANIILQKHASVLDNNLARLLHGTIILDTVNFNINANRFKKLDVDMATQLEEKFNILDSRENLHKELTTARSDISDLTPFQVLHRDMKIINGVPFPGVPMLVEEFLNVPEAAAALEQFCQSHKVKVIVPMGLATKGDIVFRDIAVFATTDCLLKDNIIQQLKETTELQLSEIKKNIVGLVLFSQGNVKMSRKHIVPIICRVTENCNNGMNNV